MLIIDANNLAWALARLDKGRHINVDDKGFDRQLISLMREHSAGKDQKMILVFDGRDNLGDHFRAGSIKVIYTPKDNYYKSADDKIIELARQYGRTENLTIVTDDNEIKEKVKNISQDIFHTIYLKSSTQMAQEINRQINPEKIIREEDDKNLDQNQVDDINDELLSLWK